ncbi:unnamed protein product [Timema podura]|uniref:ABC transporter domain-containing protein n=1 Tax=Timema podura TaxID=61482 RepID=A0ABN7P074_TIMPD|nr:unnamed protein product [Timema podura]
MMQLLSITCKTATLLVHAPILEKYADHLSVTIEFTIYEAMYYLGLLLGLERDYIHQRVSFLTQLLGLPGPNSYIHHLSGQQITCSSCGQRRRVSFALALFQEPNLLILDDPTAMVDPILRYSIWLHLHNIANNENTTVFVTTHNIQEAQNAHKVGLMRDGKIIAQEKPLSLIERFASPNLESVFYTLAVVDGERSNSDDRRSSVAPDLYEASFETIKQSLFRGNQQPAALPGLKDIISKPDLTKVDQTLRRWKYSRRNLRDLMRTSRLWWRDVGFPSIRHMGALFYKDFIRLFRNTGSLLLVLTLPCLLIALSFVTLGNTPQDVSVAVVNLEGPCNTTTSSQPMGCLYIRALRSAGIGPVFFDGKSQGLAALKDGRVCGVIIITDAFSNLNDRNSSERARIFEEIRVTVDYRDVITANFVQLSAIEAYNKFVDDLEVTSSGQHFNLTQIVQLQCWNSSKLPVPFHYRYNQAALKLQYLDLVVERYLFQKFHSETRLYYKLFQRRAGGGVCSPPLTDCAIISPAPLYVCFLLQLDDPVFDLEETSFVTFLVPGLATSLTHMLSASDMLLLIVSERRSLRWDRDHIAGETCFRYNLTAFA